MQTMYDGINGSPSNKLLNLITSSATSIVLDSTSNLPAAPNIATIGDSSTAEVILYTGKTGSTLSGCTRGFGGTTARSWAANTPVYRAFTKYDYDALKANVNELAHNHNWLYDGRDLSTIFTASQLIAAVRADDWTNIRVGDYWPITLSGTYRDYGSYTCPIGVEYFADTALTDSRGTTVAAYEATYVNSTYCSVSIYSVTRYVSTSACLDYYARTLSNTVFKLEVAAISPYMNYGYGPFASPHIVFISRDCTPHLYKMRKADSVWTDGASTNPWTGSALYKTLNEATYGLVSLVAASDIGAYMYAGPSSAGMRFYNESKASGATTSTNVVETDRGKLFVPTEDEICETASLSEIGGCRGHVHFPIFNASMRHRMKGLGNGGATVGWWYASSLAGSATIFCNASALSGQSTSTASTALSAPICFIIA